jgi:hypothetical protein
MANISTIPMDCSSHSFNAPGLVAIFFDHAVIREGMGAAFVITGPGKEGYGNAAAYRSSCVWLVPGTEGGGCFT